MSGKQSDMEVDNSSDYDEASGALDDGLTSAPDDAQLKKIMRLIRGLKMDDLTEYGEENKIDLLKAKLKKNAQSLLFFGFDIQKEDDCLEALQFLVKKFRLNPKRTDDIQQTILFYAGREGYNDIIDWLVNDHHIEIDKKDIYKQTPLYYAGSKGKEATLLKLVDMDADCSTIDLENQSALFFAARNGHTNIGKILLENGCPVNQKDHKGKGAIEIAHKFKRVDTVEYLTEKGAHIPPHWSEPPPKLVKKNPRKPKVKKYRLGKITKGDERLVTKEEFDIQFAEKFPVLYKGLIHGKIEEFRKHI